MQYDTVYIKHKISLRVVHMSFSIDPVLPHDIHLELDLMKENQTRFFDNQDPRSKVVSMGHSKHRTMTSIYLILDNLHFHLSWVERT